MPNMKYCPLCGRHLTKGIAGVRERLMCGLEGCDYVRWDNPVPVVAAIVEHEGRIVLARNKEWPEKMFGLITGFLERDESPEEGVLREVQEELGLQAHIEDFIGVYANTRLNQLIVAYHVLAEGEITLGEELVEFKLFLPEKLKPWPFGTGFAVRDWLKRKGLDQGK